jgi:hypothetical protein
MRIKRVSEAVNGKKLSTIATGPDGLARITVASIYGAITTILTRLDTC